jgi:hypothetical protein
MSAKLLLSTERTWNKEGVAGSQKWLPYHLPEGYSGVTGVRRQGQNESNRTLGNSPRRWRRARAYIDITHALELEHTTRSRANIHLWPNIANFFPSVQRSIVWIFLFPFYNFNYLHQNLTSIPDHLFLNSAPNLGLHISLGNEQVRELLIQKCQDLRGSKAFVSAILEVANFPKIYEWSNIRRPVQ